MSPNQRCHQSSNSDPEPGPIPGGAVDARVARWMEQAGVHQTRAVGWLRRTRNAAAGPLPVAQRREMLIRALEHILTARRLLLRAQQETENSELLALLDGHLARLAHTAESTERLLHDLDAAES